MKTPPPRRPRVHLGPLVETIQAPAQSLRVTVKGHGTVRPAEEIDLVPQVAGIVVWKSPRFESGGFFRRGELLVQIDPRDYRLAVEVAQAEVAQSQYALEVARGEAGVARREWEMIQGDRRGFEPSGPARSPAARRRGEAAGRQGARRRGAPAARAHRAVRPVRRSRRGDPARPRPVRLCRAVPCPHPRHRLGRGRRSRGGRGPRLDRAADGRRQRKRKPRSQWGGGKGHSPGRVRTLLRNRSFPAPRSAAATPAGSAAGRGWCAASRESSTRAAAWRTS